MSNTSMCSFWRSSSSTQFRFGTIADLQLDMKDTHSYVNSLLKIFFSEISLPCFSGLFKNLISLINAPQDVDSVPIWQHK